MRAAREHLVAAARQTTAAQDRTDDAKRLLSLAEDELGAATANLVEPKLRH
jgi:hypothetical protein